jgi:hypothetical protein
MNNVRSGPYLPSFKDSIAGVIPRHQGGIEMSKIQLKYEKGPQARTMQQTASPHTKGKSAKCISVAAHRKIRE